MDKNEALENEWKEVRAGPLRMSFENGGLRYIKWGEREILRRIYAAVRDRNWTTIPARVSILSFEAGEDSFHALFESEHREREIEFIWRGEITGNEAGAIRFAFEGEARSTFMRNRIGICVLHPAELAGAACRVRYANGSEYATTFPDLVAAEQPISAIHDLGVIAHEVSPGLWAEVAFSGDLFEMEDQRNWIDASYKTYCTPLRIPFPMEIVAGTRITQAVVLRLRESSSAVASVPGLEKESRDCVILSTTQRRSPLPPIGYGLGDQEMSAREAERMKKLAPGHLRADLKLAEAAAGQTLDRACGEASRLQTPLEFALFLGDDAEAELQTLVAMLDRYRPNVARWLIFDTSAKTSSAKSLQLARQALQACGAPIGGGSNADFYQLNQSGAPVASMDFVSFSMNPQTHAFDDASLVEALTAIPHPIRSAKHYFNDLPVVVSPITLKPRFNPAATSSIAEAEAGLPSNVDERQLSLFGAAWTLGALKRLSESEAAAFTCFETTGWRGVMETEAGSPIPAQFPSLPGAVFPLYHVLADVAEFAGGDIVAVMSGDALKVEAMLLEFGGRRTLLAANLTSQTQTATMAGVAQARRLRRLNGLNVEAAMREPEAFRERFDASDFPADRIELAPFEILRLDW